MESDKQVISRVLSGDDDAYGELITRYQGPLFGWPWHASGTRIGLANQQRMP